VTSIIAAIDEAGQSLKDLKTGPTRFASSIVSVASGRVRSSYKRDPLTRAARRAFDAGIVVVRRRLAISARTNEGQRCSSAAYTGALKLALGG
jgi:hypothetical protein